MQLSAKIDDRAIRDLGRRFPKKAPAMISRAINKTGVFARKRVVEELRKNAINVKAGDLKRRNVMLKKGTRAKPGAIITVSGSRIPLIYFAARQTKSGTTYKIDPKGGRKKIREAFITHMGASASGTTKLGVFARKTKKRLPIRQLLGPSVPEAMENLSKGTWDLRGEIGARLEKEAASQVEYELSKR